MIHLPARPDGRGQKANRYRLELVEEARTKKESNPLASHEDKAFDVFLANTGRHYRTTIQLRSLAACPRVVEQHPETDGILLHPDVIEEDISLRLCWGEKQ